MNAIDYKPQQSTQLTDFEIGILNSQDLVDSLRDTIFKIKDNRKNNFISVEKLIQYAKNKNTLSLLHDSNSFLRRIMDRLQISSKETEILVDLNSNPMYLDVSDDQESLGDPVLNTGPGNNIFQSEMRQNSA